MASSITQADTMAAVSDEVSNDTFYQYYDYLDGEGTTARLYTFAKYLTLYFQPFLCAFGFLGNSVSLVIFLSKPMRKTSSNVYLAALSGSSLGFNLILLLQWLAVVNIPIMHMQGFCQTIVYLSWVFGFLSVWFVVCVTVENYIMTFHLSKAPSYCTARRAKIIVLILTVYALVAYSGQFLTAGIVNITHNVSLCTEVPAYSTLNKIYFYLDNVTTLALPTIITASLTMAILYKNLCSGGQCQKLGGQQNVRVLTNARKSLVRITRDLFVVSITFVVLSCPSQVNKLRLLIERDHVVSLFDKCLVQIFQIVYYIIFSLNFVICILCSKNFRKQFMALFCCHKRCSRLRSHEQLEMKKMLD